MNSKIKRVDARQILDCKARPMLEVDVYTEDNVLGRGSAPTGTSVGMYESYVLRDGDPSDYDGMSVHTAVRYVKEIIGPALLGMDVMDQTSIDHKMIQLDGTPNKQKLGGNTIYSVSIACLRADPCLSTPGRRTAGDHPAAHVQRGQRRPQRRRGAGIQ